MDTLNTPANRLATRIAFLVAGFAIAGWAPLIPLVKARLSLDEGLLGLLLLCLGVGSLLAMCLTGALASRLGTKPLILLGGFSLALGLPLLAWAESPLALAIVLFGFGAALGLINVSMNIHAVAVERDSPTPLMSGFHGLFSVGGFVGAGLMTLLLSLGLTSHASTLGCALLMLVAMCIAWPRLLVDAKGCEPSPLWVWPKGLVVLLAVLAGAMFLLEGAILDWGALLLVSTGKVSDAQGGVGYMFFAVTMMVGRLLGDRLVTRWGDLRTLHVSALTAVLGFVLLLLAPVTWLALAGFLLIGAGAANIVPVLFRRAGSQTDMSPALAVAAISTCGYAGILLGPALIGWLAEVSSLVMSFWLLAALLLLVPATARRVVTS